MIKYKVGSIIWGIIACICLLIFNSTLSTKDAGAIIPNGIILGITVVGTTINIAKYHKTQKTKTNLQSSVLTLQEQSNEKSRAKLSAKDGELMFQFMQKHGVESKKHCDEFENLNRLAYEENDIDKKILLLQQTIEAFETAKQWHYNYSKGAKIYFQEFWEYLHNSQNSCFSWVDSVKENLKWQLQKRNKIIPWILENAKVGFLQTAIYKEFPQNDKADLRKIIDELASQHKVTKAKKGNSYYITDFSSTNIQDQLLGL